MTKRASIHLRQVRCPSFEFGQLSSSLLESGYAVRFRAEGSSMHPAIRNGDVLCVEPVSSDDHLHVGDIVLYLSGEGRPVVHRIIARVRKAGNLRLLIKGDNLFHVDEFIPWQRVEGKVTSVERGDSIVQLKSSWPEKLVVFRSWWRWVKGEMSRSVLHRRRWN